MLGTDIQGRASWIYQAGQAKVIQFPLSHLYVWTLDAMCRNSNKFERNYYFLVTMYTTNDIVGLDRQHIPSSTSRIFSGVRSWLLPSGSAQNRYSAGAALVGHLYPLLNIGTV